MVDVANLKVANDTQGHAAGDALLRNTAHVLRSAFRAGDVIARIGGDEFSVLLPGTGAATAQETLGRLRRALKNLAASPEPVSLQLSMGAATAEEGQSLEAAWRQADERMYADKVAHKRHVQVHILARARSNTFS